MRTGRLLFYEGWDLANAAAWDPARWAVSATGTTFDVNSGGGRITLAGVAGGYGEFGGAQGPRVITGNGDFEITYSVTFSSSTPEQYAEVAIGDQHNAGGNPLNGYGLVANPFNGQIYIQRRDNGSQTNSATFNMGFQIGAPGNQFRFRREGQNLFGKCWVDGTVEPADWTLTYTDPDNLYRGPGYGLIMVGIYGGNVAGAASETFDNLTVYELVPGPKRRPSPPGPRLGTVLAGTGATSRMTGTKTASGVLASRAGTTSTATATKTAVGVTSAKAGTTSRNTLTKTGSAAVAARTGVAGSAGPGSHVATLLGYTGATTQAALAKIAAGTATAKTGTTGSGGTGSHATSVRGLTGATARAAVTKLSSTSVAARTGAIARNGPGSHLATVLGSTGTTARAAIAKIGSTAVAARAGALLPNWQPLLDGGGNPLYDGNGFPLYTTPSWPTKIGITSVKTVAGAFGRVSNVHLGLAAFIGGITARITGTKTATVGQVAAGAGVTAQASASKSVAAQVAARVGATVVPATRKIGVAAVYGPVAATAKSAATKTGTAAVLARVGSFAITAARKIAAVGAARLGLGTTGSASQPPAVVVRLTTGIPITAYSAGEVIA